MTAGGSTVGCSVAAEVARLFGNGDDCGLAGMGGRPPPPGALFLRGVAINSSPAALVTGGRGSLAAGGMGDCLPAASGWSNWVASAGAGTLVAGAAANTAAGEGLRHRCCCCISAGLISGVVATGTEGAFS